MKTQDPREELQDGFELSPPPSAQGPREERPPPRPRLCEAGPCARYHRLTIQVDAAQPGAVRVPVALPDGTPGAQAVPGGTVYQAVGGFYTKTHHYCYPDTGIEMPLGDLPVTECNRWDPLMQPRVTPESLMRDAVGRSGMIAELGEVANEHLSRVRAWEADRLERERQAADIERAINESLAMAKENLK